MSMPLTHQVVAWIVTTAYNFDEKNFILFLLTVAFLWSLKILRHYRSHLSLLITISILIYCHLKFNFHYVEIETDGKMAWMDEDYYEKKQNSWKPRMISSTGQLHFSNGSWKSSSSSSSSSDNNNSNPKRVRFRGINLPAKTPSTPTLLKTSKCSNDSLLYETKESVSFVNRPFPIETADEHFQRLSNYGFNLIRMSVTWEAVMHEGPGIIDQDYLLYLSDLIDKAAEYGLYVIIDPHQDVWSRFTGGDGAPWWTLDVVGFNTNDSSIHDSGCAWLHQHFDDNYPTMFWITNSYSLTTATMFTLFFAGDTYAPGINAQYSNGTEVTIQTFLQGYYLDFIDVVAQTVKEKWNVLGFNSMNEPTQGYVGLSDLRTSILPIPLGYVQSAFDGMRLSSGETINIHFYSSIFRFDKTITVNQKGTIPWKSPEHDIWQKLGIYNIQKETRERILLKPDYFKFDGIFENEFLVPFFQKLRNVITKHNDRFILYAEPQMTDKIHFAPHKLDVNKYAWSPHWYDVFILMLKRFVPWLSIRVDMFLPIIGSNFIDMAFEKNLQLLKESANNLHVIVGETGIPFDLVSSKKDKYEDAKKALDRTLRAFEAINLEYILWNYKYDTNDVDGDGWNKENFSIRANNANRGISIISRPYVYMYDDYLDIVSQTFDIVTQQYRLKIRLSENESEVWSPDEVNLFIYIPEIHFKHLAIETSSGTIGHDVESQTVIWTLPKSNLACYTLEIIDTS